MSRRLKQVAVVVVVVLAVAQLIRPSRTNPPTDPSRTLAAHLGPGGSGVVSVLDRSCGDCHSNATTWPGYTQVAPLSWLMAYTVKEGRKRVNFSEWASYSPESQQGLLAASCQAASSGKMPGSAWTTLHPETRLSSEDVQTICAAAHS
ncbi:MAG TPA: heme-binding domain-containing protein [Gemmatimonadales bacterium]|jgi:hypothetical protein